MSVTKTGMMGYSVFTLASVTGHGGHGYTSFTSVPLLDDFGLYGYTRFDDYRPATFDLNGINPYYTITEIPMFRTATVSFSGHHIEQRIANEDVVQFKYSLQWDNLSETDKDVILNFYIARKGAFQSFTWWHYKTSTMKVVRFAEDIMDIDHFTYKLFRTNTLELIELGEEESFPKLVQE